MCTRRGAVHGVAVGIVAPGGTTVPQRDVRVRAALRDGRGAEWNRAGLVVVKVAAADDVSR
jgi:hypothetical protein